MIKRFKDKYKVDIYPNGRNGKRIVRLFSSLDDAVSFENKVKVNAENGIYITTEKTTILDLIEKWYFYHGMNLLSGKDRRKMMVNACLKMNNPLSNRFTKQVFIKYRKSRMGVVTNNTLNHELTYFKSMFSKLIEMDLYHFHNPLLSLKGLKTNEVELSYLEDTDILKLLNCLFLSKSKKAYINTKICLSTGCRWSEAENLKLSAIRKGIVSFTKTKNKKVRYVPVSSEIEKEIIFYLKKYQNLKGSYSSFKKTFNSLNLNTPKGQLSHILRHTFASVFVMSGGNILALQKILGHSDIKMTIRYSHLSPDYLKEAVKYNPLAGLLHCSNHL